MIFLGFVGTALIALALLQRKGGALGTSLGVMGAASLILAGLLDRLEGEIEIGLQGFKGQLARVEREVIVTNNRLEDLVMSMMYPPMYRNLQKLESGTLGQFRGDPWFVEELKLLRMLGLIEGEWPGGIPEQGDELGEHVRVTETGRAYLRLRADIEGAKSRRAGQPANQVPV